MGVSVKLLRNADTDVVVFTYMLIIADVSLIYLFVLYIIGCLSFGTPSGGSKSWEMTSNRTEIGIGVGDRSGELRVLAGFCISLIFCYAVALNAVVFFSSGRRPPFVILAHANFGHSCDVWPCIVRPP